MSERYDITVYDLDGMTVRVFRDVTYLAYLRVRQDCLADPSLIVILDEH